jgi:RsiW-degrading membrane proteinase PrsW (M82 family)
MSAVVCYLISAPLSVLPALVLFWLVRRIDRARPEPQRMLLITMALGALACAPAALVEWFEHQALGDALLLGGRFLDAFVVAALTEETLKLLVVLGYAFRRPSFDEVVDGVVYTMCASLGFGLVENVVFAASDARTGVLRAVTAVPMHAIASGVMGYFVGRARFASSNATLPLAMIGLLCAVLVHGVYDWAVFNHDTYWMLESALVLLAAGLALFLLIRHALRMDESIHGRASITTFLEGTWPTDVPQTIVPAPVVPQAPAIIDAAEKKTASG